MRSLAIEKIRNLLVSALSQSHEANFDMLNHLLGMALLEISHLSEEAAVEKTARRVPAPLTADRPPVVIGSWNWDIVNKVVYADPEVAVIYKITPEAAEHGVPQDEFGAAILCRT